MPVIKRPVFIGWTALLIQLPYQLFLTFWAGGFLGGMTSGFFHIHSTAPYIVFGGAALLGVPIISYFGKKLNYRRTSYKLFEDRIEFEEGFFSRNKKVIRYSSVLETSLRRGMLQRVVGLGTVYLATQATGSSSRTNPFFALGFGNISASGIGIRDIENPEDAYEEIRALIDESARKNG